MDEGSMFHSIFESIGWIDAEEEFDAAAALRKYRISEKEISKIERECQGMLEFEEPKQCLSRSTFESKGVTAELYRELPFAESDGDRLIRGVMDRVVVQKSGDAVTAVTVIDFKTDRADGEELTKRAEFYKPQLKVYAKAAARIFGVSPKLVKQVLLTPS